MIKIAIDLGSSVTKIFRADAGNGIVLTEPSCVAVSANGEVKAVGKDAKRLVGKTADFTYICFPVVEGEIADGAYASVMLRTFLARVGITPSLMKKCEFLMTVPCGADGHTRSAYALLAEECGIRRVRFVEIPYASAIGADAVLSESDPVFTLDVGGGSTNIAVLSPDGIISGLSMNVGGNNIDASLSASIEQKKGLTVGSLTAERIKNEIGSLSPMARGASVAEGSLVQTRRPASVSVQASEITDCIRVYIDKIIEYASAVLRQLPAEVAAAVTRNGVYLSGGVAKINSVPAYIAEKLEMRIHVPAEPQYAVISGAGALLRDKKLCEKVSFDLNGD